MVRENLNKKQRKKTYHIQRNKDIDDSRFPGGNNASCKTMKQHLCVGRWWGRGRKTSHPRILYPANTYFQKMATNTKLKQLIASRPEQQEILKEILQKEGR